MKLFISLALIIFITTQLSAQLNDIKLSLVDNAFINKNVSPEKKKTSKEKDFTFTVNPYLWTVAVGGSVQLPETQPYYFSLAFTDAVKNLKMAAMIAGRFKYKSVSLLYDAVYVKLKPDLSVPVYTGYISGTDEIEEFTGDFSLAYRLPIKNKNIQLDFYGGTRVWSMSNKLDLTASNGSTFSRDTSKTWADPIFGMGGNFIFSEKWYSYIKADIGGFGVSSDWTSAFMWGFGYKFSDNWNTTLGFKRIYIDYNKDKFIWNVSEYGLLFSLGYQF